MKAKDLQRIADTKQEALAGNIRSKTYPCPKFAEIKLVQEFHNNPPCIEKEEENGDNVDNNGTVFGYKSNHEIETTALIQKKYKENQRLNYNDQDHRDNDFSFADDSDDDRNDTRSGSLDQDGSSVSSCSDNFPEDYVPPWKACFSLCVAFLFTYSAFEAIQNLQTSLNSESHLGEISLSLMYLSVLIGSMLGPVCAILAGHKTILLISFVVHLTYTCSNFVPTWASLLSVSAALGVAMGGMAMSQGVYIASISTSYLHYKNLPESSLYTAMSLFNGLFYCCFKSTQITGNLVSSSILFSAEYNQTLLKDNACGAQVCAADFDASAAEVFDKPNQHALNVLFGSYALCNVIGILTVAFGLPPLKSITDERSVNSCEEKRDPKKMGVIRPMVKAHIGGCLAMLFNPKFVLLAPLIMANSIVIMILYTGYTKAFVTCTVGVQWVGYCMVALGVSSSFVALLVSYIARFTGRVAQFVVGMSIDISTVVIMLVWVPDYRVSPILLFVLPLMAGTAEGILQPQLQALVGAVFSKAELPSAFAAFNGVKCLAFSLYLALEAHACLSHCLLFALSLYTPGLLGYAYTEYRETRISTRKNKERLINGK